LKRGYAEGQVEMDMIADLSSLDLRPPSGRDFSSPGYRFSLSSPSLRPSVLAFLSRCFPGRWESEISEAFAAGMRDEDLGLAVREADDAVVGFARIGDLRSPLIWPGLYWRGLLGASPGSLGPIGIDPACRGLGLGLDLLRASLAELKRRCVRNTIIDWTDLGDFYAKLGFAPWKRYRIMTKSLNAKG
jgi:GNAT superfamily N-acetyltransferase